MARGIEAVVKLLGGTPDPIIAIRQLDSVCYNGNVGQTLLSIGDLIQLAYPTVTDKVHRDQMTWIHLQKLLPAEYQRDLIRAGLDGVVLADPLESESLHIDILVGVDQFWQLVSGETRVLREGMVAQRTVFGWVLSGQVTCAPVEVTCVPLVVMCTELVVM
ncbi:hypothetical protein FJT64_007213 [Amphibalanus amphitrite]|uniref:Peptidase aspartic putative domain-containing protein n=1 Tax=Amphibalanus amphitrite TaxID=1232801 RepID=A0A6A4VFK2_AMPAM|nr:hypothetical protein FJT64_007213 [Amphibalanus amphitrite]